ncbi:MAG: hypothetical protein R3E72_11085 [Steroidobacteraceae bacterium]
MMRTSQTNTRAATATNQYRDGQLVDIVVDKDPTCMPNGQTVLVSDCSAASVFAVTAFLDGGATATLQHTAGGTQ